MVHDRSLSSKILDIVVYITVIFVLLATLLPILHIVSTSFSSAGAIISRAVTLWPVEFTLASYQRILSDDVIPRAFLNSMVITLAGTAINVFMTTLTAYPLSKNDLPFRPFFMVLIVITMFFGGGLIPNFLLVNSLGMYNTWWALIIPGSISAYNLIIMMTFFRHFPHEIEESAKLDGCNDFQVLFRIVIPLSMAAVATIALFYAVAHWNSYFTALIYLQDVDKYPLQLVLRDIVISAQLADRFAGGGSTQAQINEQLAGANFINVESIKYATLVVSIVPMLIVYPWVQKYFVKGVMIGSLKG